MLEPCNRKVLFILIIIFISSQYQFAIGQVCAVADNPHSAHSTSSLSSAITIPLIFQVVKKTDGTGNLNISDIESQLTVLNDAYDNTNYSFYTAGIIYKTDNTLYDNFPDDLDAVLHVFTIDPSRVLNIYTGDMSGNSYGFSAFPYAQIDSTNYIVLDFVTLPNGDSPPVGIDFNSGDILVHEVGHWLGLVHVFNDTPNCGDGDGLSDTPPCNNQPPFTFASCDFGEELSTCGFTDPIDNYMHISGDACRIKFTNGQKDVMDDEVGTHRVDLGGSTIEFNDNFIVSTSEAIYLYDSTIKFANGKDIVVNNDLDVENVTFTSINSNWDGIEFKNGSNAHSTVQLHYCLSAGWA